MKKATKPFSIDNYKKIIIIVALVMLAIVVGIFAVKQVVKNKDQKEFEAKSSEVRYSAADFGLEEAGTISPDNVNFGNYISLEEYGAFYDFDNQKMLQQTIEKTYNTEGLDYEYFIGSKCYSCDVSGNEHYYFFGSDESSLYFYLKINEKFNEAEWFVRSDFTPPEAERNRIVRLHIVDRNDVASPMSKSLLGNGLQIVGGSDGIVVDDEETIEKYTEFYNNENYVFGDTLDEIKEAKENSDCGFVLAEFENQNVYQCIGTY